MAMALSSAAAATTNFPFSFPYTSASSASDSDLQVQLDNLSGFPTVPAASATKVSSWPTSSGGSSSSNRYTTPSARWTALVSRDAGATDAFIYAVTTTRIFCRPDCKARLARRANVRFYDSAHHAAKDGFRACKRCKPDTASTTTTTTTMMRKANSKSVGNGETENSSSFSSSSSPSSPSPSSMTAEQTTPALLAPLSSADSTPRSTTVDTPSSSEAVTSSSTETKISHAVAIIRTAVQSSTGESPSLAQLAQEVGLSKWHLQRVFKRITGLTPREMAEGMRGGEGGVVVNGRGRMDGAGFNENMGIETRGVNGEEETVMPMPMPMPLLDMDLDMDMDIPVEMEVPAPAQGDMSMFSDFTAFEPHVVDLDLDLDLDMNMSMGLAMCPPTHFSAEDALNELFPELYA